MAITINFESSTPRKAVALHAWEPEGRVWDTVAAPQESGMFRFVITPTIADARQIQFKFRFPYDQQWESDQYVRRITTRRADEFWTFDQSARVTARDPYHGDVPDKISFYLHTAQRYAGGRLCVWLPGTSSWIEQPQTMRSDQDVSTFELPVAEWMKRGFSFKWRTSDGTLESDRFNRVWRPGDGMNVNIKSGQVGLSTMALVRKETTIELLFPSLIDQPLVKISDNFDDWNALLTPSLVAVELASDPRFKSATFKTSIFPDRGYTLSIVSPHLSNPFRRQLRIEQDDAGQVLRHTFMLGARDWLNKPLEKARLRLAFSQRPGHVSSGTDQKALQFEIGVGIAPPYETVLAQLDLQGRWVAQTSAPINLPLYATPIGDPAIDQRADGPIASKRFFSLRDSTPVELSTVDGLTGFVRTPTSTRPESSGPRQMQAGDSQYEAAELEPPQPSPLVNTGEPPADRPSLMAASFGNTIARAGIFDTNEMPLGSTRVSDNVYFVVVAPNAITMQVILVSDGNVRSDIPMSLTADLRYWWCSVPATQVPHGQRYRYLQNANSNNSLEVLDPASRWVADPQCNLMTNIGEGIDCAWTRYVEMTRVNQHLAGDQYQTRNWESFLIYKLHPQRFTVRNSGVTDGFDQVTAELAPGKYLASLGVTVLEFTPVSEFGPGSWGYNPSLFFAINSGFGGPEALARCVAAAHAVGKGISMDLVFNHYSQSPMEGISFDSYVDGETAWGNQVNYDNPICMQYFRQAIVYLWNTYRLDGFRFDCTLAIINGQYLYEGVIRHPGSGGGWNFLNYLRTAVRRSADAMSRRWPYFNGENDPNNWGMTNNSFGGVMDGQWAFNLSYPLGQAAYNGDDQSYSIRDSLTIPTSWVRPFSEAVRFAESQDTCGFTVPSHIRTARRAPFGQGFLMSKAIGTIVVLAEGVPMLFQGQEGGEDNNFFFDYNPAVDRNDLSFFARLPVYEDLGADQNRVFAWYRDLIGLRNNSNNGLQGNDNQITGRGYKTVAFTRAYGRFFVIASMGTTDNWQTLSWLGLPGGAQYKEIFNSSWPAYNVVYEGEYANGGYAASLNADNAIHIPPIGGIVLERL